MKAETLKSLQDEVRARRAVVLITGLTSGTQRLLYLDRPDQPDDAAPEVLAAARAAVQRDQPTLLEPPDVATSEPLFVHPFCPPVRLLIVGAVHIAQPLSQLAALAGLEVTVIDPRTAFSTEARFPGVTLVALWPGQALDELRPDRRTAVVTLTHDPKLDDPALERALRSDAFYIGSLGSGKTHAARLTRLRGRGFTDEDLARIRGPVGLKIGARSPAEIGVSILAQLIETLRAEPAA
jgi:xanthine dehydrogenase accessory factor